MEYLKPQNLHIFFGRYLKPSLNASVLQKKPSQCNAFAALVLSCLLTTLPASRISTGCTARQSLQPSIPSLQPSLLNLSKENEQF